MHQFPVPVGVAHLQAKSRSNSVVSAGKDLAESVDYDPMARTNHVQEGNLEGSANSDPQNHIPVNHNQEGSQED